MKKERIHKNMTVFTKENQNSVFEDLCNYCVAVTQKFHGLTFYGTIQATRRRQTNFGRHLKTGN